MDLALGRYHPPNEEGPDGRAGGTPTPPQPTVKKDKPLVSRRKVLTLIITTTIIAGVTVIVTLFLNGVSAVVVDKANGVSGTPTANTGCNVREI